MRGAGVLKTGGLVVGPVGVTATAMDLHAQCGALPFCAAIPMPVAISASPAAYALALRLGRGPVGVVAGLINFQCFEML